MDERKMILEMLKEGQITSEEAIRLLDALGAQDKGKGKPGKHEKLFTFDADKAKEGWEEVENHRRFCIQSRQYRDQYLR